MTTLINAFEPVRQDAEKETKKNLSGFSAGLLGRYLPQNWYFKTESEIVTLTIDLKGNTTIVNEAIQNPDVTIEIDHDYICTALTSRKKPSFQPKFFNVTTHTKKGRIAFPFLKSRFGL